MPNLNEVATIKLYQAGEKVPVQAGENQFCHAIFPVSVWLFTDNGGHTVMLRQDCIWIDQGKKGSYLSISLLHPLP